jgi:uncharacterized repeat protein (TIGR01451 family)
MTLEKGITAVSGFGVACDLFHTGCETVNRILASLLSEGKREMIFKMLGAATVLTIALPLAAQAPAKTGVETRLDVRKVTHMSDGRESVAPAESAKPGDILEYVVTYQNNSSEPVRDFVATLPIPPATEYIAGSAKPATAKASLDARAFDAMPLKRKVLRDGRDVEEVVALHEYRYLRWSAPELGANKSLTFVARVRVIE